MLKELADLYERVQQQGARVRALELEAHDITERLGKERLAQYRLKQQLKSKLDGN